MPDEKTPLSFDEAAAKFRQTFNEEMAKQVNEYDGQKLAGEIIATLNKDRHMVIWKLLGLDDKWGRLEVDHCNGRKSPIVDMMTEEVRQEVHGWLQTVIRELIAANRDKVKGQFRKALEAEFKDKVQYYMRDCARNAASNLVEEIQKEVEREFKEGVRNARCEEAQRESDPGQTDQA